MTELQFFVFWFFASVPISLMLFLIVFAIGLALGDLKDYLCGSTKKKAHSGNKGWY